MEQSDKYVFLLGDLTSPQSSLRGGDGRIRIEGLVLAPSKLQRLRSTFIRNRKYVGCDFVKVDFSSYCFQQCEFVDCTFSKCKLGESGFWVCTLNSVRFEACDMRNMVMDGNVRTRGAHCSYRSCQFVRCNMSRSSHWAEEYTGCTFDSCKLNHVSFQLARFSDAVFRGVLQDVEFYGYLDKDAGVAANEMRNVNFVESDLRRVTFRYLTCSQVMFPDTPTQLAIDDWSNVWQRACVLLKSMDSAEAREAERAVVIETYKDANDRQRGVLCLGDLEGVFSPQVRDLLIRTVHAAQERHAP